MFVLHHSFHISSWIKILLSIVFEWSIILIYRKVLTISQVMGQGINFWSNEVINVWVHLSLGNPLLMFFMLVQAALLLVILLGVILLGWFLWWVHVQVSVTSIWYWLSLIRCSGNVVSDKSMDLLFHLSFVDVSMSVMFLMKALLFGLFLWWVHVQISIVSIRHLLSVPRNSGNIVGCKSVDFCIHISFMDVFMMLVQLYEIISCLHGKSSDIFTNNLDANDVFSNSLSI